MAFQIKKYLNPAPNIGGLEISDLALRLAVPENGRLRQSSVQMPPGVLNGGKILDRAKFVTALKGLHLKIVPLKKTIHVVAVVPTNNVYTQAFAMPLVPEKEIKEAARLNLQSISPLDASSAYYDYQMIGENKRGQLEALGAFVAKSEVDDVSGALKEAGFGVVAVEFPALAVSRLIKNYGRGLSADRPYLVAYLGSDGPDIMVVKNGHLYFNHFVSWASVQQELGGRKIEPSDVQDFFIRNVRQVMNFYTSRWGEPIQNILLVDNPIAKEINQALQSNFQLSVQPFQANKYGVLSPLWYPALGAMERGLIPRQKDDYISLAAVGVKEEFYRDLTLAFIRTWRNIVVGVVGFMLLVLLIADSILVRAVSEGERDLAGRGLVPLSEIQQLQNDVRKFNQTVNFAIAAQDNTPAWSGFYSRLRLLAGSQIMIQRVNMGEDLSGLIIGEAVNDSAVIAFKNTLTRDERFKDVTLPLSNIKVNEDGSVSFSLNFKLTSLKF